MPDQREVGPEGEQMAALLLRDHTGALSLAPGEVGFGGFKRAQALLPLALEAAGHQPVVGIDGTIATLCALRFVGCPLHGKSPLLEHGLAIGFEVLGSGESGGELGWLQGGNERLRDGLVDLHAADIEAIDPAALEENLARAMIPRRGRAAAIVCVQAAAAMTAAGEALQQCTAFSHRTARFVRSRSRVLGDACLVSLISLPVDKAWMMLRDENLPLGAWQAANTRLAHAASIQDRLLACFAIGIGAGTLGVGQHVMDGGVARLDPADLCAGIHLQRQFEPFGMEPQPDAACRAHLGKPCEDVADGADNRLVRVQANLAVGIAPDQ